LQTTEFAAQQIQGYLSGMDSFARFVEQSDVLCLSEVRLEAGSVKLVLNQPSTAWPLNPNVTEATCVRQIALP
jgi:hypothetical protein